MAKIITRSQLALALERCCEAHPSTGIGRQLHPDASLMADLFGHMLHHRESSTPVDTVTPDIRGAYQRWEVDSKPFGSAENSLQNAT
jgi:hypothetical protein